MTEVDGIACTAVARTLLDLAAVVPPRQLDKAVERAEQLRIFDGRAVEAVLDRAEGRAGARALERAVALFTQPPPTRSELEDRFLHLCEDAGLPRPLVNSRVETPAGPLEVDFCWPDVRLIVETDGRATHDTAAAFERDRRRDQLLMLAGWRVLRFTWRQVVNEPARTTAALLALLTA